MRIGATLLLLLLACLNGIAQEAAAPAPPPPPPPPEPPTFLQVQMHVWISETTEQGLRDLGTNLNYTRVIDGVENPSDSLQQITTNVFDPGNPLFTVTLPAPDTTAFMAPLRPDQAGGLVDGVQTQSGAGLVFSIIEAGHGTLGGVFRAVEQKQDVDLISKPELLVIDGMEAEIKAGGKVPFQDIKFDGKGNSQLYVAFKDIGVNMKITPHIRSDNQVRLNLTQLEVTDLTRIDNIRGVDLPVISKRSQTGVVIVPNGQTVVIGGLSSKVVRKSERRVPGLGRIPILGLFFRGRQSEVDTVHLMVFVSPTIVDLRAITPRATSALDFWRKGGWRHTDEIQQEIDILEE